MHRANASRRHLPEHLAAVLLNRLGQRRGAILLDLTPRQRERCQRTLLAHARRFPGDADSLEDSGTALVLASGEALSESGLDTAAAVLYACEHDRLATRQDGAGVIVRALLRFKTGEALLNNGSAEACRRSAAVLEPAVGLLARLGCAPASCRGGVPETTPECLRFHTLELLGYCHLRSGNPLRAAAAFRLAAGCTGRRELKAAAWALAAEALAAGGRVAGARRLLRSRWQHLAGVSDPEVLAHWRPLLTVATRETGEVVTGTAAGGPARGGHPTPYLRPVTASAAPPAAPPGR
jgi:hypothetical protein